MNEQLPGTGTPLAPAKRPPVWPASVAAVLIVLGTVAVVYLVLHNDGKVKSSTGLAGAFAPQINYHTVIHTALSDLKVDPKLVVLTLATNVQVSKSNELKLFWGINLGTTTVDIRAADNKVQYYIPLNDLDADDMSFDANRNVLRIIVPQPVLDEDMVDVQSDPEKIEVNTDVGWARLNSFSGEYLRQEARKDLRPAVIEQGRSDFATGQARDAARQVISQRIAGSIADKLNPGVEIQVEFEPSP